MKVTRDMVDKDLRGRYAVGRILARFFHTRWFSLLVFRLSGAALREKTSEDLSAASDIFRAGVAGRLFA